jgi:hypothetical protein
MPFISTSGADFFPSIESGPPPQIETHLCPGKYFFFYYYRRIKMKYPRAFLTPREKPAPDEIAVAPAGILLFIGEGLKT